MDSPHAEPWRARLRQLQLEFHAIRSARGGYEGAAILARVPAATRQFTKLPLGRLYAGGMRCVAHSNVADQPLSSASLQQLLDAAFWARAGKKAEFSDVLEQYGKLGWRVGWS